MGEETLLQKGPSPTKPVNTLQHNAIPSTRARPRCPLMTVFCRFVNLVQSTAMHSHLTRQQLEALTLRWEHWEAEAATMAQKIARARLHLLFLLFRYGGLRLGEALTFEPRAAIDSITGMMRVPGPNARELLLPLSAMRHIRRIISLPQAGEPDFLRLDQAFVRKKFYAVGKTMGLPAAVLGPRAIRYSRGLELLDLHVPMSLVQKFLGQQDTAQLKAFLDFSDGQARKMLNAQAQNRRASRQAQAASDDATNLFWGIVTGIHTGMRKIHVEITTFSDVRLTASCTHEQAGLLEVHENQVLSARVDPERVALSAERIQTSLGNCARCVVESLHADAVETFVCLSLPDGAILRATVETPAVTKLHLAEGKKIFAYFPTSAVTLLAD